MGQRRIVFYGASGHAIAVRDMLLHGLQLSPAREVAAYIDDFRGDTGADIDGVPVITFEMWRDQFRDLPCVVTVGEPEIRRRLATRLAEAGAIFDTWWPSVGSISPNITVAEGSLIGVPIYIGPQTSIGRHAQIMPLASLGHDCTLGDFVTVCPSASISGYVTIEDDVFIGVGATIVNGTEKRPLSIGRGAVVYAGAVVTKSIAAGAKVGGNPAKPIDTWRQRQRRKV